MKLFLIQHGEATSEQVDPLRPLTSKGEADVRKIASFLKGRGVKPALIYHSGKLRAKQTAEIIATTIALNDLLKERRGLLPQDPINDICQEIGQSVQDLMIVGHLPSLSKLANYLLTGKEDANLIAFRQGGVVCLQRDNDQLWRIGWMVIPDLL